MGNAMPGKYDPGENRYNAQGFPRHIEGYERPVERDLYTDKKTNQKEQAVRGRIKKPRKRAAPSSCQLDTVQDQLDHGDKPDKIINKNARS
jgi:hypothetical protein